MEERRAWLLKHGNVALEALRTVGGGSMPACPRARSAQARCSPLQARFLPKHCRFILCLLARFARRQASVPWRRDKRWTPSRGGSRRRAALHNPLCTFGLAARRSVPPRLASPRLVPSRCAPRLAPVAQKRRCRTFSPRAQSDPLERQLALAAVATAMVGPVPHRPCARGHVALAPVHRGCGFTVLRPLSRQEHEPAARARARRRWYA